MIETALIGGICSGDIPQNDCNMIGDGEMLIL